MGFMDLMSWMAASDAADAAREGSERARTTGSKVKNLKIRLEILEESQKAEMRLLVAIADKLGLNAKELCGDLSSSTASKKRR